MKKSNKKKPSLNSPEIENLSRKDLSLSELFQHFPDDETAEEWMCAIRWKDGIRCPDCQSDNTATSAHKTMPYRCRDCDSFFSVKKGTVMQSSKIGAQKWVIAIYAFVTNLKGISSTKLRRELGISQKAAWYMAHRIRAALKSENIQQLTGTVEVDETYIGGKEANKHQNKRLKAGRGTTGKPPVIGAVQREGEVIAAILEATDKTTFENFVTQNIATGTRVITDEHKSYAGISAKGLYKHTTVAHSRGQYTNQQAHTNTIESFWAALKRGIYGIYHQTSKKHLQLYLNEFTFRHNIRKLDTLHQMEHIVSHFANKTLTYKTLTAP